MVIATCEICGVSHIKVHDVPTMGLPMPDPNYTTTQEQAQQSVSNPFVDPPVDPRAVQLQEQRDQMAAGQAASVSLSPNYEALKVLTQWLAEHGWDAMQVADAVKRPEDYWVYYQAAIEGGELSSGD